MNSTHDDAFEPRHAIIYCRVSTPGQERDGTSLESQESACRAYADQHGFSVAQVVRETGSGAELWERPLLSVVRADIKRGGIAALIIYDLDRLARNPVYQAIVIEECDRAGVSLEIVLAPLDSSPEGMLIAYVRGYAAQIEREKIRERQMRGKRQRALNGKIHGAGPELYGYRRDHDAGVRHIYEPEARVVRDIFTWVALERLGIRATAQRLVERGISPPSSGKMTYRDTTRQPQWGKSQILRIIKHPAYKGVAVAWRTRRIAKKSERQRADFDSASGRVIRPESEWIPLPDGVTPPLVTPELWEQAQEVIREHQARMLTRNAARFYLLRGLVWCGRCGRRMESNLESRLLSTGERRRVRVYRCNSRNTPGGACGGQRIPAEPLEVWVWERISALIRNPDQALSLPDAQTAAGAATLLSPEERLRHDLAEAHREVERSDRRQADLMQRYTTSDGAMPWEIVEREVTRLESEKRRWHGVANDLETRLSQRHIEREQAVTRREQIQQLRPALDGMTPEQRRTTLDALSTRITGNGRAWQLNIAYPIERAGKWVIGVEFTT